MAKFLRSALKEENIDSFVFEDVPSFPNITQNTPSPQSLNITINRTDISRPVEIDILWSGFVRFLVSDVSSLPASENDVSETAIAGWSLQGALIVEKGLLGQLDNFNLPVLKAVPNLLRYESVALTTEFLLTTLPELAPAQIYVQGTRYRKSNFPETVWRNKLIYHFVRGEFSLNFNASTDTADLSMPVVASTAAPALTLNLSASERCGKTILSTDWFKEQPYDLTGTGLVAPEKLVPLDVATKKDELYNPRHPGHSILPMSLLVGDTSHDNTVWQDNYIHHPFRNALKNFRDSVPPDMKFRRLDFMRPPIPDSETAVRFRRQYPAYQVVIHRVPDSSVVAQVRLPINGQMYLRLTDNAYTLRPKNRTSSADVIDHSGDMTLCLPPSDSTDKRIYDEPQSSRNITVSTDQLSQSVYVILHQFDSLLIRLSIPDLDKPWAVNKTTIKKLKSRAQAQFNVRDLNSWILDSHYYEDYIPILGYMLESAGRHRISPEFLNAVMMGEGVAGEINDRLLPQTFDPDQDFDTVAVLGLDWIANDHPDCTHKPGRETDIGLPRLMDEKYIEIADIDAVIQGVTVLPDLDKEAKDRNCCYATIIGWRNAIEITAAICHARLDQMLSFSGKNYDELDEYSRRFLTYYRFNATFDPIKSGVHRKENSNWYAVTQNLSLYIDFPPPIGPKLKKWPLSTNPSSSTDDGWKKNGFNNVIHYLALKRVAVSVWQENAEIFR